MKRILLLTMAAGLLLISGCATYKQLKPQPPLSPKEQGYVELKKNDTDFMVKKEKKYFIAFPQPPENNFFLVMDIPQQDKIATRFTAELAKKSSPGPIIDPDKSSTGTVSVYPISAAAEQYYWLIDNVTEEELALTVKYRYVPQWRWKFENHHAAFKKTLADNKTDRTTYNALGKTFHFNNFNFVNELAMVNKHRGAVEKVHQELLAVESLFPASIVNSQDKAYLDYKTLKKEVESEVTFLKDYGAVLDFFYKENRTRGKVVEYLELTGDYIEYFRNKNRLPTTIVQESQKVTRKRLEAVPSYYNGLLSAKEGWTPLEEAKYRHSLLAGIDTLCRTAGLAVPQDVAALTRYVTDFNRKSKLLTDAVSKQEGLMQADRDLKDMPADAFYPDLAGKTAKAIEEMPLAMGTSYGFYGNFRATKALDKAIASTGSDLDKVLQKYRQAEQLVPRLNAFKGQKDYSNMISLLNKNAHLDFLVDKYRALDAMSIDKQAADVKAALGSRRWPQAERILTGLHRDRTFLDYATVKQKKRSQVLQLEDALYSGIDKLSREKILKFVEEKVNQLEDIDSLYADSVFVPAYNVTFSSGSQNHLVKRKQELVAMLRKMKEDEFPARAITLMYDAFKKNYKDNGVLRCRAIVAHGKHYQGNDKKLRIRMAEVDPWLAKTVRRAKDYRSLFALPVTDNRTGKNRYVFRVNLAAPTKAKFPVWDVTIKLPKTVGKGTAGKSWYKTIKLNKKLLKNEGRFSIAAPTAENNWECQITPVQTKKGRRNILEVVFEHPSFVAHPVSVMMQKPIIKKN